MAIELIDGINQETCGKHAGFIAASFMAGRAFTSLPWGMVADRYGRVFVLLSSLLLSAIFSLGFGTSRQFARALCFRFSLGLSNGIVATLKTIVSEICRGNEKAETDMMSLVIGMWGLGFLVSPVISGILAEPQKQYASVQWIRQGRIGWILKTYPFLLPNLLGAVLCLMAALLVYIFVAETLPASRLRDPKLLLQDATQVLCQCCKRSTGYQAVPVLKEHDSDVGVFVETSPTKESESSKPTSMKDLWTRRVTRVSLCIYWVYSFAGLTVDELFPLFCMSQVAGFGLSEKEIGEILALVGLIFISCQYFLYSTIYDRFGLLGALRMGALASSPALLLLPLAVLMNHGAETGTLNWTTYFFLAIMMAQYRIFGFVFFTSITVLTNRSVSSEQRATMNGLSMLGGSAAKALGPVFAGFLASQSVQWMGSAASILMYGVVGMIGILVALSTYTMLGQEDLDRQKLSTDDGDCTEDNMETSIEMTESSESSIT
jgi:MFS family permease